MALSQQGLNVVCCVLLPLFSILSRGVFKEISRGDAFPFNWPHGLIVHDSVAQENVTLLASLTQNDLVH